MSRCFPFPPPGYEKKAKPDDANLLTKEKHKEKKHKKDKKDRERREGKEKRDKERSEEKHREKKDRKEKPKEKKDEDKDKEKKKTPEEKKIVGPPDSQNGEKTGPNCMQSDGTMDSKVLLELGKRIKDNDGATENRMVKKTIVTNQKSVELPGKVVESNIGNLAERNEKFKDKREDGRKVNEQSKKVEPRGGMENGFVLNFSGGGQRKIEGVAKLVEKDVEKRMEGRENNKHKDSDSRGGRHKDRDPEKKSKSKDRKREKEKEKEEKTKEKEPNKEQLKQRDRDNNAVDIHNIKASYLLKESKKSSGCKGNPGKRKELEMNGFLHDNDIRPNKLPRLVFSSHQVVENGRKLEPCQTAIQFASECEGTVNNYEVNNKVLSSHPVVENGRELEPCQTAIHFASEWQGTVNNHKVNNKVSSSHLVMENVSKFERCQTAIQSASERRGVLSNHKVDNKEPRINGLIVTQRPNDCSARPSSVPVQFEENLEASGKPPHRDSKYLSQILSIPKIEWSDFDDQEWLFSSNNLQAKKPKLGSSQVEGTKQVWAEALQVESADVTALPYVIPY